MKAFNDVRICVRCSMWHPGYWHAKAQEQHNQARQGSQYT
jgi:hypothetical protein